MQMPSPPDTMGRGLVNLAATIEQSFGLQPPHPALSDSTSETDAERTTVLVLFDGLGVSQLEHPKASELHVSLARSLDAPFPTTTTVSLATIATGRTPSEHGVIAYLLWDPALGTIVNTIHMRSAWGDPVAIDLHRFLPSPNLFERLAAVGIESVVVQPENFRGSALTTVLYRGARFEGYRDLDDAIDVTLDVAAHRGRLIVLYVPHVDVAAHVSGQASADYERALSAADTVWSRLHHMLPPRVTLLGTSDHGHTDIADVDKIRLSPRAEASARLSGDGRAMYVSGDPSEVLMETGGLWVPITDLEPLWGKGSLSRDTTRRSPDGAVFMQDGTAAFTRYMNDRLVGHHGGLTDAERLIPLLTRDTF
jgi:predicted AlkP superfamily pyrophosphatase or phosphodiesterase